MTVHEAVFALFLFALPLFGCAESAHEWSPEEGTLLFMSRHGGNADIYLTHGTDLTPL